MAVCMNLKPITMFSVFIIGATGYLGGEVLYQLLNDSEFDSFKVTCLTRTEIKGKELKSATGGRIEYVVGDFANIEILENEFAKADIVINVADCDDVPSVKLLAKVAKTKAKPFYIIHTSGIDVLHDGVLPSKDKHFDGNPISDLYDNDKILGLPSTQPHRPAEQVVFGIDESNPSHVKTVIISPPTIYGFNQGYIKRVSDQLPLLAKLSVKNKQAFTLFDGNYQQSHVHVTDLARFYILVLKKLLNNEKSLKTGKKGYYFVENGYHFWKDVSAAFGKALYERNAIPTKQVAELTPEQITKIAGFNVVPHKWGLNGYVKSDLSRSLGWKPQHEEAEFWNDIENLADYTLTKNYIIPKQPKE